MDDGHEDSTLLRLDGISKGFHSRDADLDILCNVDFSIGQGETIAVVGASGIGKSTLLHVIGTLDRPDRGELYFKEKELFSMKDEKLALFRNKRIGFVFQFHHLLAGFTALENVMIPCMIASETKKRSRKKAVAVLERMGLAKRLEHRVEDLSGGEQQRVAMARALVMEPDILLADEPTGNLDRKNSKEVHSLLMELNRELGMTLMVVTHNNDLAGLMAKQVTINEGRVVSGPWNIQNKG
ncbi:MAG: ABC transporter ATP-binding protein [Desulfobacteraceae bacterium]